MDKQQKLTPEELNDLFQKAHKGDENAVEKLVQDHLGIIISISRQLQNQGLSQQTLIDVGIAQLKRRVIADRDYDYFIRFIAWCVRQSMLQALMK